MQHNKAEWWKFWLAVFRALHVPQLTKWLNSKLTRKRCATCEHWLRVFLSEGPRLTNEKEEYLETLRSIGDTVEETEHGECKNPTMLSYHKTDENFTLKLLKEKVAMFYVDAEDGYGGVWLYTHKDHCCGCWMAKTT